MMTPEQQNALFENTARAMGDAPREVKIRHCSNCMKADAAYGEGVTACLGISIDEVSG
jgi:catalase